MSAVKKLRDKWLAAWEDGFDVGNMETILFKLGEAIEADVEGAVPLETMIEEIGYVELFQRGEEDGGTWIASNADQYAEAPTVYEAISALYDAWRERE